MDLIKKGFEVVIYNGEVIYDLVRLMELFMLVLKCFEFVDVIIKYFKD